MSATWTNCSSREKVLQFRGYVMDRFLDQCGIPSRMFYRWQKVSSEHKTCAFSQKNAPVRQLERRIVALEATLSQKGKELTRAMEALAEVMEEHIRIQS